MFENWVIVIITFGLLIVTYLYMQHTKRLADDTKRMADIIAKDYEIKIRPLSEFEMKPCPHQEDGLPIDIELFNLGEVPINSNEFVLTWWFRNNPNDKHEFRKELENKVLYKERTYKEKLFLPRFQFEIGEAKGNEAFNGYKLFRAIDGEICLHYLDYNGKQQKKCKKICKLT